ncbi:MAG: hypothetical protein R2844_07760 [Caldilineales bacterium]
MSPSTLGQAIVEAAKARGLAITAPAAFQAIAGGGILATVDDHEVLIGTTRLLESRQVHLNGLGDEVTRLQAEAKTAMLVAVDGEARGSSRSPTRSSRHRLRLLLKCTPWASR